MIEKFKQHEFEKGKLNDLYLCECEICHKDFLKSKRGIIDVRNKRGQHKGKYCSKKCYGINKFKKQLVECKNCKTQFLKQFSQIIKYPNHFCCQSCAATYNNQHKTKGTRISKLELWLQEQLTIQYPSLEIHYNHKETINSELDIYIPSLNLAFELNGIFHYEPIYGEDKLKQIQNNDNRKFQACLEKGIELVIIDSSNLKYWKPEKGKKYLNIINEIIVIKISNT